MKKEFCFAWAVIIGVASLAIAQSNIDTTNKHAWGENTGWTNWRDANASAQGVNVGGFVLAGYAWGENIGFINAGDGSPGSACGSRPCYANANNTDFGVNIDPGGDLHGYAWAENVGWINFDGGATAAPPQPARIDCDGRFNGYVWGENIGWINLSVLDAGKFVAVQPSEVPLTCDVNQDGFINGKDVARFVDLLINGGATWVEVCSGDTEASPDGQIDLGDVAAFVSCLLS